MRDETRKRLSELILEELSEKIKTRESLGSKLEAFADLPVEKVAEAILKQFEYLLSSELRGLIIHMIEQEIKAERATLELAKEEDLASTAPVEPLSVPAIEDALAAGDPVLAPPEDEETAAASPRVEPAPAPEPEPVEDVQLPNESIMEHFGTREPFPSDPMDIALDPSDWFYLYGFSYAPISTGRGVPSKRLRIKGVDETNRIFLLDSGDVRLYLSRLSPGDYPADKSGKPTLTSQKASRYKYEHEKILNTLRTEEVVVPLPFWSIVQGIGTITALVEDRYVDLLKALIEVHDAVDWDVEVYALDEHIVALPEIAEAAKGSRGRETKHASGRGRDIKVLEKLIFKEKSLAQEVHSSLLVLASKSKIDFMIRLDNAMMDDWKSILQSRYIVPKDRRKAFCQTIAEAQEEHKEYQLMIRLTNPAARFTLVS
jgi:hypothetical protein